MGAGEIGYIVGGFFTAILVPVLILIVCNFVLAARRNPKIVYGICAARRRLGSTRVAAY
jgi:hypothetical protein